jgi:hypothetical protein
MNTAKKQDQQEPKTAQPQLQKTRQENNRQENSPAREHERPELRMTD